MAVGNSSGGGFSLVALFSCFFSSAMKEKQNQNSLFIVFDIKLKIVYFVLH